MSCLASLKDQFESNLKQLVLARTPENLPGLYEMVSYHFGWNDTSSKIGKRLRPLLLLTSGQLFGRDPLDLMPAAVAMEVLHNYTLIHDDIEDQGETRHGRACLWRQYGLAQALNVGDYLSTMAHDIFLEVQAAVDPQNFDRALSVFRQAAMDVIRGQYLDMRFEKESIVSINDYLDMIRLKTSCLIAASIRIGAILSGVDESTDNLLKKVGENAGLAFQIQDDYLGIWGNTLATGKSNLTDLATRKKTYPILLGLAESPAFKAIWDANAQITPEIVRQLSDILSKAKIDQKTNEAVLTHLRVINEGQEYLNHDLENGDDTLWTLLNSAFNPTYASTSQPDAQI